jgi:hypothetical protein
MRSAWLMACAVPSMSNGIDDQRLDELARSACERRENQHARRYPLAPRRIPSRPRFMPSCRLLTTQKSHARYSVYKLVRIPVLAGENDRLVVRGAETLVDPLDRFDRRALQLLIDRELAARRRGDLHEHELAAPLRLGLEEPLDRQHPVDDPLGVIPALDAHAESDVGRSRSARGSSSGIRRT